MKTYTVRRVRQIETTVTVQATNSVHATQVACRKIAEGEYDERKEHCPDTFKVTEGEYDGER